LDWRSATKESRGRKAFKAMQKTMKGLYNALYGFVLHSFKSINGKVMLKIPTWRMEEETVEHVHFMIKMFKWVVLPVSILYACADFFLFGENAFDSMLWGMLLFFYSNFLPDLPSIYRKKKSSEEAKDLPWYKKYALLLLAPLLIWILFSGMQLTWKTTETFHNFRSLTVYSAFLFIVGFFAFVKFPASIANVIEVLSIPIYGAMGYLAHLKVDKIW